MKKVKSLKINNKIFYNTKFKRLLRYNHKIFELKKLNLRAFNKKNY